MSALPEGFGRVSVQTRKTRGVIDEVTGYDYLSKVPHYARFFEALNEDRKALEDTTRREGPVATSVGMSNGGNLQLVAKIPPAVFTALVQIYGAEWLYHGGLREWLSRHPEYRVGKTDSRTKT